MTKRLDIDVSKLAATVGGRVDQMREYLNTIQLAHEQLFAGMMAALEPKSDDVRPTQIVEEALRIHGATLTLLTLARAVEAAHQLSKGK